MPTSADVVTLLARIVRRVAHRLADEARDDSVDENIEMLAQVQAEAATTWRSPQDGKLTVRVSNACARGVRASPCTPAS